MERRTQLDRRARPTEFLDAIRFRGQRTTTRRCDDVARYVDRPDSRVALLTLFVVIGSAFDALFTLLHLGAGATEANPIMSLALDHGLEWFLLAKVGVTTAAAWFLAAHHRFGLGRSGLRILAATYGALLIYHVAIFYTRG